MLRVCSVCEKMGLSSIIGEKEPIEDKRKTHTYCDKHYKELIKQIEEESKKRLS